MLDTTPESHTNARDRLAARECGLGVPKTRRLSRARSMEIEVESIAPGSARLVSLQRRWLLRDLPLDLLVSFYNQRTSKQFGLTCVNEGRKILTSELRWAHISVEAGNNDS